MLTTRAPSRTSCCRRWEAAATLRGYPNFRFRDRNRLLMTAELRWTPARFLDMAVFYDAGKVASRRQDLDFNDLRDSYGIGMRVIALKGYALGLEVHAAAKSGAHPRQHGRVILMAIKTTRGFRLSLAAALSP